MKRSPFKTQRKPMRRTRFEQTQPGAIAKPARELPKVDPAVYRYSAPQVAALFLPVPKRQEVRSDALMKAYRTIPCQVCNIDDGTVCGAHSNWAVHGKGLSQKADDNRCASLCFHCHAKLDQGKDLSMLLKQKMWWRAHVRSVGLLTWMGRWPKDVAVPDVETKPWDAETLALP